jgi:hypothetical protein
VSRCLVGGGRGWPGKRSLRSLVAIVLIGLGPPPARGSGDDLEEILEGFEEVPPIEVPEPTPEAAERPWQISGLVDIESAFNLDQDRSEYEGLAMLRTELRLQLDSQLPREWKLRLGGRAWYDAAYAIHGRDEYTSPVLDAYEFEHEVWESWIGGPLGDHADLRFGRQITTFGTSELLRVVDVVFPIDNREPGAADLEDLYLPELHARLDVGLGGWDWTALAILERRFSEQPPRDSSYLPPGLPVPRAHEPSNDPSNTEFLLAGRGRLRGVDLGLIGAYYFQDLASFEAKAGAPGGVRRFHERVWLVGATAVAAWGNWVFRSELAGIEGLSFANEPDDRLGRIDALLGFDYFGFGRLTLAFDFVDRWIPGASSSIEDAPDFTPTNQAEWAARARLDLLQERLHLTLVGISLGIDTRYGGILRLQGDYDWNDALTLSAGLLLYASGDLPQTSVLGSNDRIWLGLGYRF